MQSPFRSLQAEERSLMKWMRWPLKNWKFNMIKTFAHPKPCGPASFGDHKWTIPKRWPFIQHEYRGEWKNVHPLSIPRCLIAAVFHVRIYIKFSVFFAYCWALNNSAKKSEFCCWNLKIIIWIFWTLCFRQREWWLTIGETPMVNHHSWFYRWHFHKFCPVRSNGWTKWSKGWKIWSKTFCESRWVSNFFGFWVLTAELQGLVANSSALQLSELR